MMPAGRATIGSCTTSRRHAPLLSFPFSKAAASLFTVLFPTICPVCNRELQDTRWISLCKNCWQALRLWDGPCCASCGLPFASAHAAISADALCAQCRTSARHFDLARSYGLYTFPLRNVILELKFHRRERWGLRIGGLIALLWPSTSPRLLQPQALLVPVPLHADRQRERGFNQAELLAHGLRAALNRSGNQPPQVEGRCLRRALPTRPQSGLSPRARFENVRGVFVVNRPETVRGRAVILIDDVMTTGATISSCARALKEAGASQVLALTLARATPQFPDTGHAAPAVDGPAAGYDNVLETDGGS
ncbi:MAG: ComF family protein [Candidatus Acidiferrales bacterium]